MLKIGILAPQSSLIKSLARDYRLALKLGLEISGNDILYEIFIESAGYNASAHLINGLLTKLLLQYEVDIIVAPVNPLIISQINSTIDENDAVLVATTIGENLMPIEVQSPNIFINSFHLWQCAWLSGYEFVHRYGSKVCFATGFHDGAYGYTTGLRLGIEAAGGVLVRVLVSPQKNDSNTFVRLFENMEKDIDLLIGQFSGVDAYTFVNTYRQLSAESRPHLTVLPQVIDDLNNEQILGLPELHSLSSWNHHSVESLRFCSKFREKTGRDPNIYSLLAFETGALLAEADNQKQSTGLSLYESLTQTRIFGPRGETVLEPSLGKPGYHGPFHLCRYDQNAQGIMENQILESIDTPGVCYKDLQQEREKGFESGWLNPYLIA